MDPVTDEYLRRCRTDERLRAVMSACDLPEPFRLSWRGRHLPRPVLADRAAMTALGADLKALFDVVVSLPGRLYDGDLGRLCAAVGIDDDRAGLITRLPDAVPPRSGRADLYRVGDDFRLLEFNVNTGFSGGADIVELGRALLAASPFSGFAEEFGVSYVDVMAVRAAEFRAAAGADDPVIALVEADGALEGYGDGFRSMRASVARYGVDLHLAELAQLYERDGRIHLGDRPLDLVLRYYNLNQIVADPAGRAAHEMLCRAHERGTVVLHTSFASDLYDDKTLLALLSSRPSAFSASERDLIDRLLPWTRLVRDEWATADGERVDLLRYAIAHRDDLVLKPGAGLSGSGVVAGWETDPADWERLLRRHAGGPYIVQRRVRPTPEPYVDPETGALEHVVPAWGVFFSGTGFNGGHVRTAPSGGGAVINFAGNPKSSITALLTYSPVDLAA